MTYPNLFLVGVPKAGTTSLYNYLRSHPDIFLSDAKEPYFFADDLDAKSKVHSEEQYLRLFEGGKDFWIRGEATPAYVFSRIAAKNIAMKCPEARILIALRNPVDMLYSLHGHFLKMLDEDVLDFETALALQDARKQGKRIPETCKEPKFLQYYEVARYSEQIERYLDALDRNQIKIILYDDLTQSPSQCFRSILEFLEVGLDLGPPDKKYNVGQPLAA